MLCGATAAAGEAGPTQAPISSGAGDDRPDVVIDASARKLAIESLVTRIDEYYPIPEVRKRLTTELRRRSKAGAYDRVTSAKEFRTRLTSELRELSHDEHFNVEYFVRPRPFPEQEKEKESADPNSSRELIAGVHNQGFDALERLPGNVGYMRLRTFEEPGSTGKVIAAAMDFLSRTDAMIIDLRYNKGGYGETGALLASYFLSEATELSEAKSKDGVKQKWSYTFVPGAKYLDKPVYVLMSKTTFSAPEAFAYDLQALKRVIVVGEVSRGGANPSVQVLLSDRFGAIIPWAVTRNPITNTSWDGKGVTPDIPATSDQALDVAHLAAARAISAKHPNDSVTGEIEEIIHKLGGEGTKQ
ncbi:MAG TPA: S41 family peptidase [Candidatus Eisenbacteria bacterium]|jgi:C-terminal processing protease CtpA/Prc|nr:S41 family peptidase [Candidatus Eisenbacteria bacterium]